MKIIFILIIVIFLSSCASVDPNEVEINETDLSENEVYAFIGKKISVRKFEPEIEEGYFLMDEAFIATYEVIEQYSGVKLPKQVQFEAYDHYGFPNFARHDTALVYLKKVNETLYHIKYTYDLVRLSTKYGWVACGIAYDWNEKPILEPLNISLGKGCFKGNIASNVAKARILVGDVK